MSNPFAGQQYAPPSDTRGPMLLQATWIQTGIATPFLVARVYARWRQMGRLGWDDYLMILSLVSTASGNIRSLLIGTFLQQVFAYITAGFTTAAVNWGFGQHMYYLSVEQKIQSTKLSYILAPFAIFSLVFGRVSFAVSLLVLLGVKKWRRWLLHFVIVSQFVATTVLVGIGFFVCLPVRKYWDRRVPGKCLDHRVHRYASYVQGGMDNLPSSPAPPLTLRSFQHLRRSCPRRHASLGDIKPQSEEKGQVLSHHPHGPWCLVSDLFCLTREQ